MKIAAVQTIPTDGNIERNLNDHKRLAELAADNGAQLAVFPEMSLTGYLTDLADIHSFTRNDPRLEILQQVSSKRSIIIIAGAPIKIENKLYIGSFILFPDRRISIYTKQFLHKGEEQFFSPCFDYNPIVALEHERISLAICADITNPIHPSNAYKNKSTLYIPSIFYTPNGIAEAYGQLSEYSKKYSMNVLMANYGSESNGFPSAGKSAFWDRSGKIITAIEGTGEGLILVSKENENWIGRTIIT